MVNNLKECQNVWQITYQSSKLDDNGLESSNYPWESVNAFPTEIIEKFISRIPINDHTRILDFGCGTGRIGRYIEKKWESLKTKVYYYDIAEIVFDKYLQDIPDDQKIRPNIDSIVSFEERSFHEIEQFDGIVVWGVFHHLPQNLREYVWHLIKSIIKPDGHILIAEFNNTDVLFKEKCERISEITKNLTYAVSPIVLVRDSFDIKDSGSFKFQENQELLKAYSYASTVDKENRINKERTLEYVIATPNWLECQKNVFTKKMTTFADFSHLLVYEFKNSLNNPENRIGTYYTKKELCAMELWLKAMGLMSAYDQINKTGLLQSSYSSLLFKDSLKRYSFIAESKVEINQANLIAIKIKKDEETLCDNLFNITLTTSKHLDFELFEEAYRREKGMEFPWTFRITHFHNNNNSYHRGALEKIKELQDDDLYIYDSASNDIVGYLNALDVELKRSTESLELEDSIVEAIRLILLFITPTTMKNAALDETIKKTYTAIVPPVFETSISNSGTKEFESKQITASGAIMFTTGSPFKVGFTKADFVYSVLKWSSVFTTKSLVSFAQKASLKSAIAAIMARNFKHNHGSHVLNNLSSDDEKVFILKKNYLGLVVGEDNYLQLYDGKDDEKIRNQQRAYFLNYLNARMGYISDVSYDSPMLVENHSVFNDIFVPFDKVRALLDHISGLENNFKFCIRIEKKEGEDRAMLNNENDFRIAIPDGLVGLQAFYNIVENVIRNTAKHSKNKPEITTFTIRFSNVDDTGLDSELKEEAKSYYCVEIFDNVEMEEKDIDDLVKNQIKRANSPIVVNGRPRSTALGIAEMEISSSFLRHLDPSAIDDDEYEISNGNSLVSASKKFNLVKPIKVKSENSGNKYHFGYRFFVLRPEEILIVSDKTSIQRPEDGIKTMTPDAFCAALNHGEVFNQNFLVIDTNNVKNVNDGIARYKTALPLRILEMNIFSEWNEITGQKKIRPFQDCWNKWFEQNSNWVYKKIENSANNETAVYDHHRTTYKDFCEAGYIEVLSSLSKSKMPEYKEKELEGYLSRVRNNRRLKQIVLEAANNKVLIVDERIQQSAFSMKYSCEKGEDKKSIIEKLAYYDLFRKTGVYVPFKLKPNDSCNNTDDVHELLFAEQLKKWNSDPENEKLSEPQDEFRDYLEQNPVDLFSVNIDQAFKDKIEAIVAEGIAKCTFVIIHYGLLERVFGSSQKDLNERIKKWANESKANIVVISDRGIINGLDESVRFVSFSSVKSALVDIRSKYLLNILLYASRKVNTIN